MAALTGVACFTVLLGYKFVAAESSGYCSSQQRYISDAEYIRTVGMLVERDMGWVGNVYPNGGKIEGKEKYLKWSKNWADVNPNDPKFSTVHREKTHSIFNRMFGLQAVDVWIGPQWPLTGVLIFHFDICGNLLDSDIGLPDTVYPVITTKNIGANEKNHGQ